MTDRQAKIIADALRDGFGKVAEALEGLGCRISEDEPLNYAVARGLDRLAEAQKR
jgi:hypothetical protein